MANCLFAPLNWVSLAGVEFTGGDWLPALPAAALATADPLEVARSLTAAADDTRFTVDLGAQRRIDVVGLFHAAVTPDARIRVASDEGWDSGWRDAWPVSYVPDGGYLPFGRPSADGRMPADECDPRGVSWFLALPAPVTARTLTVEIDDAANPAGFVQAGLLFAGKAERPSVNLADGFQLAFVEETTVRRSLAGTLVGRRHWRRRRIAGALRWQDGDLALGRWLELVRRAGRLGPVLFSLDPEAGIHRDRLTILGHLDEPGPVEQAQYRYWGWPFALTEA